MKNNFATIIATSTFLLIAVLAAQNTTHAQDLKEYQESEVSSGRTINGGPLAGIWNAQVNITVCATGNTLFSFESMGLFGSDGTFLDTNSQNPATKSSTFGYWRQARGREYQFAMRFFRFSPTGSYLGTQIVRHTIELSLDRQTYYSYGTAEFYDPNGTLVNTGCSTALATRFQ